MAAVRYVLLILLTLAAAIPLLARSPDSIAARVTRLDSGACTDRIGFEVVDLPDDDLVRSNIAQIDLIEGTSNASIEVGEFEAGVAPAAGYTLRAIDPAQDAQAVVRIYDKAGNATYDTVRHSALRIAAAEEIVEFGTLPPGTVATRTVELQSMTRHPIVAHAALSSGGTRGFTLSPADTVALDAATGGAPTTGMLTVRFNATATGDVVDTLVATVCGVRVAVAMTASVGTPIIEVTDFDFGAWPVTAPGPKPGEIEIRNTSTDSGVLTVTGVAKSFTDALTFTLPNGLPAFPLVIAAGESVVLGVAFAPGADASYLDSIVFEHNAPPSPRNDSVGSVRGRGIATSLVATSYDFGQHPVGSGPHVGDVRLYNSGSTMATLRLPLVLIGDTAQFEVGALPGDSILIAPGDTLVLPVAYSPTTEGPHVVIITYPHDGPSGGAPLTSLLFGIGASRSGAESDDRAVKGLSLAVAPNPARGGDAVVRVETRSAARLALVDATGRTIADWAIEAGGGSVTVATGALAAGSYHLVLGGDGHTSIRRFVVAP